MLKKALVTLAVAGAMSSAFAVPVVDSWKFDSPGHDVGVASPGDSCGGTDTCGNSITFTHGGLTATATGGFSIFGQPVIQDLNPENGGLGVLHSDDEVDSGEWLNIHFNKEVKVTSVAFNNGDHGDAFLPGTVFDLFVDGVLHADINLASIVNLGFTGTDFAFANQDWHWFDDFYLAGMNFVYENGETPTPQAAIPEPSSLALLMLGMLGVGYTTRKRKLA